MHKKTAVMALALAAAQGAAWARVWPEAGMPGAVYINNGKIQVGVDPGRGAAVFHFSEAGSKTNVLNHADEGRLVQQSYYGNPDGSTWWGKPWRWNPIQGGGSDGRKARTLSLTRGKASLKAVTEPVQWATGEPAADCVMEEEITLRGRVAHIRYTMRNTGAGARTHVKTHQEIPAVFADWDLPLFVCYAGERPWTGDTLTTFVPRLLTDAAGGQSARLAENWAAYTDSTGWGVGVYSPKAGACTLYRFGQGPGGPGSSSCSYFAPLADMAVTEGMTFTYDVYLTIGKTGEIRRRFARIHKRRDHGEPAARADKP